MYAINLGGDSSRVIDLLKALNLDLNSSLFGGVSVAQGAQQRTTYKLNGKRTLTIQFPIFFPCSNLTYIFRVKPEISLTS